LQIDHKGITAMSDKEGSCFQRGSEIWKMAEGASDEKTMEGA
jgi:hypothetical protein